VLCGDQTPQPALKMRKETMAKNVGHCPKQKSPLSLCKEKGPAHTLDFSPGGPMPGLTFRTQTYIYVVFIMKCTVISHLVVEN
jgi:hypothetical protein